jgi:hypothetical protein
MLLDIDFNEVYLFVHAGLNDLILCIQNFSLFFSLRVRPMRSMVNDHYCHILPFMTVQVEMFSDGLFSFLGLNGGSVVVYSSAEITRFPYILF